MFSNSEELPDSLKVRPKVPRGLLQAQGEQEAKQMKPEITVFPEGMRIKRESHTKEKELP